MWNNAGLSTSVLITTCSPANGMVHHTVAVIFVTTKLRDLGPKSSAARTFWRMVATCIRYQPPTKHLLWDLTTFSLASVKTPCVGTSFLGLAYPFFPTNGSDDTPEFPQIQPICPGDYITAVGEKDVFRLAIVTPLPPAGLLETVLLSLKEGESLSESTVRRLRRKEAEMRAAAAEGRTPLSQYRKRKQKRMATRTAVPQETSGPSSKNATSVLPDIAFLTTHSQSPPKGLHQKSTVHVVATVNLFNGERQKVSSEDVGRLAASASARQYPDSQGTAALNNA